MAAEERLEPARPARLGRRAVSAALSRRAELRHAVRVSVAVGAAYAAGRIAGLPQSYWAVFTAVIVVQTSIGATITASVERLLGTLVGALVGVAAAWIRARTVVEEGVVLAGAVALAAFLAAVRPSLRVAPITAAIVLVGGSSRMDPTLAAVWRVIEIVIGGVIGVAATLLIFPAPASRALAERAARSMELLATLLDLYGRELGGEHLEAELHSTHQASRKALAQVEQSAAEAARESATGLGHGAAPEGLIRSLWRVRNDIVTVGRALAQPLPGPVGEQLAPSAVALIEAVSRTLRDCADAARKGLPIAPADGLPQLKARFEEAVERVRRGRLTADMTFDPAARVFGLVFALESVLANLADLCDRIDDMASTGASTGAPSGAAPGAQPVRPA